MALIGFAMLAQVACAQLDMCAPAADDVEVQQIEEAVAPVVESCGMPVCGALGTTLLCIEGYESGHYGGAVNRRSGAAGWLQWLPGTARAWGVIIGDRQSEWFGAARIAAQGRAFFRSQWVPLQLGLC